MGGRRKHFLKSQRRVLSGKKYKTSNNYTTLIQHSKGGEGGAFLQCTSFKVQRKKRHIATVIKSSYIFHIIVLKRKPINNNDCLMLQFYSKDKTKIAANSQGSTSTELSFHGSCNAYKVLPVGYTSIIHNLEKKKKIYPSNTVSAEGMGLIPGQRAKIRHVSRSKNQNIKQQQYCNKLNKDFKNGPCQKKSLKKN